MKDELQSPSPTFPPRPPWAESKLPLRPTRIEPILMDAQVSHSNNSRRLGLGLTSCFPQAFEIFCSR